MQLYRLVLVIDLLALTVNAIPLSKTPAYPLSLNTDELRGLDTQADTQLVPADQASPSYDTQSDIKFLNTDEDDAQTDVQPYVLGPIIQLGGTEPNLDRRQDGLQKSHGHHHSGQGRKHTGQGQRHSGHGQKHTGQNHADHGQKHAGQGQRHAGQGQKHPGNGQKHAGHPKHHGNQQSDGNPKHHKGNPQGQKPQTGNKVSPGRGDSFAIHVVNSCSDVKHVGIYGVTSSYQAVQYGGSATVAPGQTHVLQAPFHAAGLRLTANAQLGKANVFQAQSLFEFGYSQYRGQEGTSYDLSLMQGDEIGMAVDVLNNGNGSGSCPSKKCGSPSNCPADQGWTDPNQASLGSPADTTCYKGKTAFKVTLCPN